MKPKTDKQTYLLRGIPSELWLRAKHYALDNKTTVREMILKALEEYLNKGGKK